MVREEVAYECQCVCVCVCDSHFKTIESSWRLEMPGFGATKDKLIIQIGFKHTHTYRVKEVTKVRNQTHFLLCQWTVVDTNPETASFSTLDIETILTQILLNLTNNYKELETYSELTVQF